MARVDKKMDWTKKNLYSGVVISLPAQQTTSTHGWSYIYVLKSCWDYKVSYNLNVHRGMMRNLKCEEIGKYVT